MTQEDKELLLKDLCARLPYDVKVKTEGDKDSYTLLSMHPNKDICIIGLDMDGVYATSKVRLKIIKPYLRPMSSMTEEEKDELLSIINKEADMIRKQLISGDCGILEGKYHFNNCLELDWLNKHHFDYRGLIPMGLALPAPEGMYNEH